MRRRVQRARAWCVQGEFRGSLGRLLALTVTGCSVQRDAQGCTVSLSVSGELDGVEKSLLRRKVAGGVKERMGLARQKRVYVNVITPALMQQQHTGPDFSDQYL